ncbi:MAG: TonB family protein [Acidobacteriota bacterium]
MNTRERFGSYVLLKKLGEDPLGETFRAGRFGAQGIEQVVLLRVLNGTGLPHQLWQRISDRADLQGVLKSPNLGHGVDFGEIDGTAFVAYDYISGKDVAALLVQAQRQHNPVPMDHALLISERIALGLSNAYENRFRDSRVVHGFVTPHLVMISNEGETRSLGFEISPGLRELAPSNPGMQQLERYLSPETLAGQPPAKSDDVYSLGVILYELLTGEPYAQSPDATFGQRVDIATLAETGEPLPAEIATLLKRSLAPRDQRIGDVVSWHKAISQLMIQLQQNPTTFNLAFFMHSLFREEIERETREIQVEKTIEPNLPPAVALEAEAGTETIVMEAADLAAQEQPESKSSKGPLIALVAALVLLAAGGAAYFQLFAPAAEESAPAAVTTPAPVEPAGPTEAEILAKMEEMQQQLALNMEAKSDEMRDQLAREYEQRQKELERQLADARTAVDQQRQQEEQRVAEEAARLQAEKDAEEEAARLAAEADAKKKEEEALAAATKESENADPTAPTRVAQVRKAEPGTTSTTPRRVETRSQTSPPPSTERPTAAVSTPATAPEPKVTRGQLVEAGPGVVPPRTLEKGTPRYPPAALRMKREAVIVVKVLVDENGKVDRTELVGKKAGFGLDDAAIAAAKRSTFRPATKRGVPVKMWHTLRFNFRI